MKIIEPSYEILSLFDNTLKIIERAGRVCYKSEELITKDSAEKFIRGIIKSGHTSVLEHAGMSVRFICDRGISHEIVRHRIASYSQESTRYCNYSKDRFGNHLTFIKPYFFKDETVELSAWRMAMDEAEQAYLLLIKNDISSQEARSVLPNSLKTELIMTTNMRSWRNFFDLRCDKKAHPQMRELSIPLFNEVYEKFPVLFEDIAQKHNLC